MRNVVLLMVNLGTLASIEYPSMMFMPAKKRIIERSQPEKIPQWCLCQVLVTDSENDLLKIHLCFVSVNLIHYGKAPSLCEIKRIGLLGMDS